MKDFWNQRYSGDEFFYGTAPNVFLTLQAHRLRPGQSVLAVADGEGRNGVWLARQGLNVTAVDFSPVAVEKARRLANQNGVAVRHEIGDLFALDWPESCFDAIVAIFIQFVGPEQRRILHGFMKKALKPGGLLILQGYRPKQLEYKTGGPSSAENLYTEETLREEFADMEILHLAEHDDEICEGEGHCGKSALVDMVARKGN
ncbi:MAG: class I SAM-dependent methyltransferase [Betaproteobacteria bacterium]|nr:class I SAM-dependent methyltransferase [Betaproteobacteria bacterium]